MELERVVWGLEFGIWIKGDLEFWFFVVIVLYMFREG